MLDPEKMEHQESRFDHPDPLGPVRFQKNLIIRVRVQVQIHTFLDPMFSSVGYSFSLNSYPHLHLTEAKNVDIGTKRKRGRSSKEKTALFTQ